MGYNRKSNCDVDLTVDAMEMATTTKAPFELVDDIQVSSSPALPSDASLKVQREKKWKQSKPQTTTGQPS